MHLRNLDLIDNRVAMEVFMENVSLLAGMETRLCLTNSLSVLQNRAFQQVTPGSLSFVYFFDAGADKTKDTSDALLAWTAVGGPTIEVVNSTAPISSALPNSLQVSIPSNGSGTVGVANSGYTGSFNF